MTCRRFRYWRDPLCLAALACYALNRCWWIPAFAESLPWLRWYLADFLTIPAVLPLVLWVQRKLHWRTHDQSPTGPEIWGHLAIWVLICEIIGPLLLKISTFDPWDLLAYGSGAILAGWWWRQDDESRISMSDSSSQPPDRDSRP